MNNNIKEPWRPEWNMADVNKTGFGLTIPPNATLTGIEVNVPVAEEKIDHPSHYGGDTVYETIKVVEAWDLNFHLGNAVKYISRAGKKGDALEDLKKAQWYLSREIERREKEIAG